MTAWLWPDRHVVDRFRSGCEPHAGVSPHERTRRGTVLVLQPRGIQSTPNIAQRAQASPAPVHLGHDDAFGACGYCHLFKHHVAMPGVASFVPVVMFVIAHAAPIALFHALHPARCLSVRAPKRSPRHFLSAITSDRCVKRAESLRARSFVLRIKEMFMFNFTWDKLGLIARANAHRRTHRVTLSVLPLSIIQSLVPSLAHANDATTSTMLPHGHGQRCGKRQWRRSTARCRPQSPSLRRNRHPQAV